jgi:outer membrane receptor protein involved in Fe transport
VSLNVENLFDRAPPFYNNSSQSIGFDPTNANLLGRSVTLRVRKAW